jgi:pimeloyl-ACP methyl ester carboxylesterase
MSRPSPRDHALARTRGALALTGLGLDQLTTRIHEFHRAISDIPFRTMAPVPGVNVGSDATRLIHDGITDGVYGAVRGSLKALFGAADFALREAEKQALALPVPATPAAVAVPNVRRDLLVSALAGFVGDDMAVRRNPLAPRMGFYRKGQHLALEREALAAAYPQAAARVVVLIHGLACNEHVWDFYAEPGQPDTVPYPQRLEQELGYTVLRLRYNTGLHISRNGARLARQLQRLLERYPQRIDELVLIGHSMGGLVARAAVAAGLQQQATWTQRLSTVICLGSPHRGSPLERVVHNGTRTMDAFALSRPLAKLLRTRAVGVKDLGHGYVADADWRGRCPDTSLGGGCTRIPRLASARYHFIGCSIGVDEQDPIGRVIGDGLVRLDSSTAAELADADTAVLFRTHHLRLLNHPVIWGLLRDALQRRLS